MKAHELIKELGKVLRLPNLALDSSNVCRVLFDDQPIDFEALPEQNELYLIAELGPVPTDAASFRRLLEINRYGIETCGATVSIDPDREAVILHRQLDIRGMDYPEFEQKLQTFYGRLMHWKVNYHTLGADNTELPDFRMGQHFLRI